MSANDLIVADYDILKYKKSFTFNIYKQKYDFYMIGDGCKGVCYSNKQMQKTKNYFNKKKKQMFEEKPQMRLNKMDIQELRFTTIIIKMKLVLNMERNFP